MIAWVEVESKIVLMCFVFLGSFGGGLKSLFIAKLNFYGILQKGIAFLKLCQVCILKVVR